MVSSNDYYYTHTHTLSLCVCVSLSLSLSLSVCVCVYLSICLSVYLSIHLSIYLSQTTTHPYTHRHRPSTELAHGQQFSSYTHQQTHTEAQTNKKVDISSLEHFAREQPAMTCPHYQMTRGWRHYR